MVHLRGSWMALHPQSRCLETAGKNVVIKSSYLLLLLAKPQNPLGFISNIKVHQLVLLSFFQRLFSLSLQPKETNIRGQMSPTGREVEKDLKNLEHLNEKSFSGGDL